MIMLAYSALLTIGLVLSAPWWLFRMATTERYRDGLGQRLGLVPSALKAAVAGKRVVWLHAVSVGEVLAATRLVAELEAALGDGWMIAVSTTTRTGQALARQRFGPSEGSASELARVFYMPLDFAFAVRAYLRVLKPTALILMESELWPRLLHECSTHSIPVAVANARVSDRSFARAMKVRSLWKHLVRKPTLWMAQSDEDARRLTELGARQETVQIGGNLKYDIRSPKETDLTKRVRRLVGSRPVVIAGSTTAAVNSVGANPYGHNDEEDLVIGAWMPLLERIADALLIVAPRHPERFGTVEACMRQIRGINASELSRAEEKGFAKDMKVLCLNTIGDLASMYELAQVAFVGGSLVPRGGHNPLEPAQFGVPVVIGPSFENFRDIVGKMQAADAIHIVQNEGQLEATLVELLTHPEEAKALGQRGRAVFESQQGATARTVAAILAMLPGARP